MLSVARMCSAFRIADVAKPSVLKGGKERNQPEQRHRNSEHRQATAPSHLASLARAFRAIARHRKVLPINKSSFGASSFLHSFSLSLEP